MLQFIAYKSREREREIEALELTIACTTTFKKLLGRLILKISHSCSKQARNGNVKIARKNCAMLHKIIISI